MRFLCPRCRADFPEDLAICPRCGVDIQATWRGMSRLDKLIWALDHRDASTRLRAARLLGQLGDLRAIPALAAAAGSQRDPYIARVVAEALGEIGGTEAEAELQRLEHHPAAMVREAAMKVLRSLATTGGS